MKKKDSPFIVASVALHSLLLLLAMKIIPGLPGPQKTMILSIETIPGNIPLGEGSGTKGQNKEITDQPSNPSPLANSVKLRPDEVPVKKKEEATKIRSKAVKVIQAPAKAELEREHSAFPIGLNPRENRSGDTPSEGGLGDNRKTGTANGAPQISGPISSRGYRYVDWDFPSNLPEESTLVITIVVAPNGLVKSVQLTRASGYPEIDQNAVSKAKSLIFDPLPVTAEQVDMEGVLTFTLQYKH